MKILLIIFLLSLNLISSAQKNDCNPFQISAVDDFKAFEKEGFVPFYVDKNLKALAVNAAQYKAKFALAEVKFSGPKKQYKIKINTISENDGESSYKLIVNGKELGKIQNTPTEKNNMPQSFEFGTFRLKPGDVIGIAFDSNTNGKIPEGETTAYSRGRWTSLEITPVCK